MADHTETFWSEQGGRLDDHLAFTHGADVSENGVAMLDFARVAGKGVIMANSHINTTEMITGKAPRPSSGGGSAGEVVESGGGARNGSDSGVGVMPGTKIGVKPRPFVFEHQLQRPEWLNLLVEQTRATPPASSALVGCIDAVYRILRYDSDARTSLSEVFAADLRGGAHDCFADAGQFAAAAAPPLLAWYYKESGDNFRDAAFPPSAFLLEVVARRWDDVTSSPEKSFEQFTRAAATSTSSSSSSSSSSPPSNIAMSEPDPAKPLNSSPAVKLSLMDHESWVLLVGEAFALGLLVEEKLRHHGTNNANANAEQDGP